MAVANFMGVMSKIWFVLRLVHSLRPVELQYENFRNEYYD